MPETRTVSTSYLRPLLAAVEAIGIPAATLLLSTRVTPDQVMQSTTRLSISMARVIWKRALELTGDRLLGLRVAEHMKPATFRVLGLAIMSCATLSQAIALVVRYQRLVSEAGTLSVHVLADGNVAVLHAEQDARAAMLPQQTEALLAGLHLQSRWLTQRPLLPVAVSFRHPPQGDLDRYLACFGVVPTFGAAANTLVLTGADLDLPLPYADAGLCRMHCELADQQHAGLPQIGYVASYAVQWLTGQISGNVGVGDLAVTLGMSVRTLQRALREEGTSWTALVDEARRTVLSRLLEEGCSLEDAAQRLGYHDASSLSRAARRWFGESPKRWISGRR
ncbi:MAG: AraC family transcriptional regulator [Pseudomonadota bacterium]